MASHGMTFATVIIAAALGTLLANWASNNISTIRQITSY